MSSRRSGDQEEWDQGVEEFLGIMEGVAGSAAYLSLIETVGAGGEVRSAADEAADDIPEAFREAGRIEVENVICDCGDPADKHEGFTGGCTAKMECGHRCVCPGHSGGHNSPQWEREFNEAMVIHRLEYRIAELLSPEDQEVFWKAVYRPGWAVFPEEANDNLWAAFELLGEEVMALFERLHC